MEYFGGFYEVRSEKLLLAVCITVFFLSGIAEAQTMKKEGSSVLNHKFMLNVTHFIEGSYHGKRTPARNCDFG